MSSCKASLEQKRLRRQLGVNVRSCLREYREIEQEGSVDMTDIEAIADAVMTELVLLKTGDPEIDWQNIDWEKLFEFILKIIQMFMAIV